MYNVFPLNLTMKGVSYFYIVLRYYVNLFSNILVY